MKSLLDRRESAVDDYNEAIRLKPGYAEIYYNRGFERTRLGQYELAIDDCNKAIRLKPDFAEAYYNRGNVHVNLGNIEGAKADFQIALELAKEQGENELIEEIEKDIQELNETE